MQSSENIRYLLAYRLPVIMTSMKAFSSYALTLSALLLSASSGAASDARSSLDNIQSKPGEGVLCLWALTSIASEVGKHCPGKRDPVFQAALEESVIRFDRYVAVNGPTTASDVETFKRRQGGLGQDPAALCSADALQVYDGMHRQGATVLQESIVALLARPGTPAWGDCL